MSDTSVSGSWAGWLGRIFHHRADSSGIPHGADNGLRAVRQRDQEDLAKGIKPSSSMIYRVYTGANMLPWIGD